MLLQTLGLITVAIALVAALVAVIFGVLHFFMDLDGLKTICNWFRRPKTEKQPFSPEGWETSVSIVRGKYTIKTTKDYYSCYGVTFEGN